MPQIQIKLTDCFPLNQILSHSLLIRRITEPLRITDLLFGEIKDTVKLQLVLSKEEYACGSFVLLCSVMISQTCMTLRRIWRLMRD